MIQDSAGGRPDRLRRPKQVGEQLFRGEERPQAVEGGVDARLVPQALAGVGQVIVVEGAVEDAGLGAGKLVEQVGDEQLAGDVVGPAGRAGAVAGAEDRLARQGNGDAVGIDGYIALWHSLPVTDHLLHHPHHPLVTLDDGGGVAGVGRAHAREQVAEGVQHHVGLPEGREYLADVAEEGDVRADDQDAAAFQGAAVSVEEVGGAVQGGDRLAGSRATLDDEDAGELGADHAVLLGLDRGDHIDHAAGPRARNGRDEGGLARERAFVFVGQLVQVEYFVVDAGDLAQPRIDVAAADQADRVTRGGGVEGPCRGGTPVDQLQLVIVIAQPNAADVKHVLHVVVGTAEAQAALGQVQLGYSLLVLGGGDVPL